MLFKAPQEILMLTQVWELLLLGQHVSKQHTLLLTSLFAQGVFPLILSLIGI